MKTYIFKAFIILIIITLNSCTDQSDHESRYIIENATDRRVKIKFYDTQVVGVSKLVLYRELDGAGIMYDELKTLDGPSDKEIPKDVFGADSLVVIFDKEKIQSHYSSLPFENSLSDFGDYLNEGNMKSYIISEENYQSATSCDGACE
ncbi:hypothetical protein LB465_17025 [Salegentibacter sp. LM13S]|uniref:hypothetical protein n=1 Tax=Salegentibacter lacus TaxID=2873599 RepID=UPI001CCB872A|nr:hypothetical protein [Salegentibacter lacus]MBZ9632487.1 hypothetical protein [Salegentibacter lacus]